MAKSKLKYGKVEIPASEFKDENASIRISMMIPLPLYRELKKISLNDVHQGKYQILIKAVLEQYVSKIKKSKKAV